MSSGMTRKDTRLMRRSKEGESRVRHSKGSSMIHCGVRGGEVFKNIVGMRVKCD